MANNIDSKAIVGLMLAAFGYIYVKNHKSESEDRDIAISTGNSEINQPDQIDDVIALARMLTSETSNRKAKRIIGWITKQVAARRKQSILQLLTHGKGWGKQDRRDIGDGIMYASTSKKPSAEDISLAQDIINDNVDIPESVRNVRPGAWYEKLGNVTDKMLIDRQKSWNEGLYAKIDGTKWYLYSSQAPKISDLDEVEVV